MVKRGKIATPGVPQAVVTTGETFADGTIIEMVSCPSMAADKPQLLFWNGHKNKTRIGPRVEHSGRVYEAPELQAAVCRAMRLPANCCDYASARALYDRIRKLYLQHLGLEESVGDLLTCFAISTWVADRLLSALSLKISCIDEQLGIAMLRALHCICRHPILLAEVTPASFRSLPMNLSPTLLLDQRKVKPGLHRLLSTSNFRGLYIPGTRGSLMDPFCPKALLCSDAAADAPTDGLLHISVPPSERAPDLNDEIQAEMAQLQPQLLMYRLRNLRKIANCRVEASKFDFTTRPLAYALAQCFPEDAGLAHDVVQLVGPQDKEARELRSRNVDCVVIEIIWHTIHTQQEREIPIDELTRDVNVLLVNRGELLEYSAEEVGWKLSKMKIPKHRDRSGQHILLGRETSQIVHRLARSYGLECSESVQRNCPDCEAKS